MPAIRALIIDDSSVMRKIVELLFAKPESISRKYSKRATAPKALAVLEQSHVRSRVRERSGKTTG